MRDTVPILANGFLPTRGSFVLDFVFLGMFAIVIGLLLSIFWVKFRQLFRVHKRFQIGLSIFLIAAITIFEIDVRFITDWRVLASESRFYDSGLVDRFLWIHLSFAIPTPIVWLTVVVMALRRFPAKAAPGEHSQFHRRWGWIAVVMMLMTTTTGCVFYWLAFVC